MDVELSPQQKEDRAAFRHFARREIAPGADRFDREESFPAELVREMAARKYLGAILPPAWGGAGMDMITYGLLNEEVGGVCSSARSLITVHDMVAYAILKWGSAAQKERWLPRLASGESIAAFAVSEPNVGSDAKGVETTARGSGGSYRLDGVKRWITFGQVADLFLVLASCEGGPTAFLVERGRAGLSATPMRGLLGVRASMLAEVRFEGCEVPAESLVGRKGFGLLSVASTALGLGRYSVAWGCVGIAEACLRACVEYAGARRQFGAYLKEHQLVRQMLSDMTVNAKAARLLCCQAGCLKEAGDPREAMETFVAKYFASRAAMAAASDAVQIHGANGCGAGFPVQRYFRDAKIMEIIEGSNQIQQLTIADYSFQEHVRQAQEAEAFGAVGRPESGRASGRGRGER